MICTVKANETHVNPSSSAGIKSKTGLESSGGINLRLGSAGESYTPPCWLMLISK